MINGWATFRTESTYNSRVSHSTITLIGNSFKIWRHVWIIGNTLYITGGGTCA